METLVADGLKGRPIEFSEPPGEQRETVDTKLIPDQTRLGQLENQLSQPFENFTSGKTLDGMMLSAPIPVPPSTVPSQQARELSERKQDWMFLSPEELFAVRSVENKHRAPELTADGRDKNQLRPMTRAYLEAVEIARSTVATNTPPPNALETYDYDVNNLLPGVGGAFPSLTMRAHPLVSEFREMLGVESTTARLDAKQAFAFFKPNRDYQLTSKPSESELQRVEQFKQIYDFNTSLANATATRSGYSFSSPYVDQAFFAPRSPAPISPPPSSSATVGGNVSGSATPSWTTMPPPAPEPSRTITPAPSPFFEIPRRGF